MQAKANLARNADDNTFSENDLDAEIDRIMDFEIPAERRNKVKRIRRDAERPGKTQAVGQLLLPGFAPTPYEPDQLLPDGNGRVVEKDLATAHYIDVQLQKAENNFSKQTNAIRRKRAEADAFTTWSTEQLLAGRPNNETTFGNWAHETGHWNPDPVDGDDEGDED
jgi:hypothetical protein